MDLKEIVGEYLIKSGEDIKSGTCHLKDDEIQYLAQHLMHKELNKTEAADLLNLSVRNFDRKINAGELPKGQHEQGNKQLIWYEDELLKYIK